MSQCFASFLARSQLHDQEPNLKSAHRAIGTRLVRTKWIVIGLQSCVHLVWRAVCRAEWSGHP